tara:strand:+ start:2110 stop:2778 length:669 start_codon:yes stop_codon:yes gene_type:complete
MRLLFLGCSWTNGCELDDNEKYRFSTIIGKRLNAEVVNLSADGRSNHAIARIFLEQDLSQYDRVFVQLTQVSRTEWYDSEGKSKKVKFLEKIKFLEKESPRGLRRQQHKFNQVWEPVWDRILVDKERFMITGNIFEGKEWWIRYYEEIYNDEFGESEEKMIFYLIKNRLTHLNIPHLIFSINSKCKLPVDLQLNQMKYPRAKGNHPNKIGHIMIASDILKLL